MLTVIRVLAGALATARLTRLATADKITEPLRLRTVHRHGEDSLAAYLAFCPWCQSIYYGLPVAAAVVATSPPLRPTRRAGAVMVGLLWLAYSHLTGLLAGLEED